MHVLRQVHRTVRPGGVLVDIHPLPQDPRVEITGSEGSIRIGKLDSTVNNRDVRNARKLLAGVQREGLFRLERRRMFDFRMYHDTVDAWLQYRRDHDSTSVVPPQVLRDARREMRAGGSKLAVIERARASVLRRVDAT